MKHQTANDKFKIFFAMVFAILCAVGGFCYFIQASFINPYPIICDLVSNKIYLNDKAISDWKKICLGRTKLVTPFSSKKLILQDIHNVFELLKVSHLEIYDSKDVQSIWSGIASDTGIKGEYVDSEFVIFKVFEGSPAHSVGLKKGDLIVSINQENPSAWSAANEIGKFQIRRGNQNFEVEIKEGRFQRDDRPSVEKVKPNIAVVTVPSFRGDIFTESEMNVLAEKIQTYNSVILDLRGNMGGNFVAGLRLLSLFICEEKTIGKIKKPRAKNNESTVLPNDLNDENQLRIFEQFYEIELRTFKAKNCFKGKVQALVDGKTASVAELVAQALREVRKSTLSGSPSRGSLLVGVWYPFSELSSGVQVSIPEAFYTSLQGEQIEGQGILVDQTLYYSLPEMQQGIDSWIKAIVNP